MKFLRLILTVFVVGSSVGCADAGESFGASSEQSSDLIVAAKMEIALSKQNGSNQTACSIFVRNVLLRAGHNVPTFMANDFEKIVTGYLPEWTAHAFTADSTDHGQDQLKELLNSKPDHTAFLAQWPRVGRSGHVAIIEKVSTNEFVIYQAQQAKSTPHGQSTTPSSLLYSPNQWGDRTHLRIFTNDKRNGS